MTGKKGTIVTITAGDREFAGVCGTESLPEDIDGFVLLVELPVRLADAEGADESRVHAIALETRVETRTFGLEGGDSCDWLSVRTETSADTESVLEALRGLGVGVERIETIEEKAGLPKGDLKGLASKESIYEGDRSALFAALEAGSLRSLACSGKVSTQRKRI